MSYGTQGEEEGGGLSHKEQETLRFMREQQAEDNYEPAKRGGGKGGRAPNLSGGQAPGSFHSGEAAPFVLKPVKKTTFTPNKRVYMNIVPILFNIFLPWMFFCYLSTILSFKFFHNHANLAWLATGIACAVNIFVIGGLAVWANKWHEPMWFKYAWLSTAIAIIGGVMFGYYNYYYVMFNYYAMQDLKTYPGVDVGLERGQNLMDAGRVYFAHGNHVDPNKAWHFKHGTTYCVAPIVGGGLPNTGSYDFWAVGKDCCSISASDFRCGDFTVPNARSGLRVLSMEERPYYRLAVQQAETAYGILASHPIFFEWTVDPLFELNEWNKKGLNNWLLACCVHFGFCIITACCAAYGFSWIGRGPKGSAMQGATTV